MSQEIPFCDCEHNKPSPMNIEVNAPYTDSVREGPYATVQCAAYGCLRQFNTRFGYFQMKDGMSNTEGAARKICQITNDCNQRIVFLAKVEGGRWYCFHCHHFEDSLAAA
ncbi:MAG: hypothetical protein QOJ42_2772 [Acidobacteriaceae bacterium]|jgi:hypothetical protein|nr:hypothetical protein [Acidobacteriaceae bacterium]